MAQVKNKTTKGVEVKVKPIDGIEIEWTDKSKFHKEGDTSIVHRIQADKLVEKGAAKIVKDGATETKPLANEDGSNI